MIEIPCLDHGFVRLVDSMGSDISIVRAARVSYNADWRAGQDEKSDSKLIRYLMKNNHTTPFESVVFTFEIKCPLFVARQWHRHRTWTYNELSARYASLDEGFYIPEWDKVGRSSPDNKQKRDIIPNEAYLGEEQLVRFAYVGVLTSHSEAAFRHYQLALEKGIPREVARLFLPVNAYTRYFGTVDLHNLLHFIRLRAHPHAQYEMRVYAYTLLALITTVCPTAVDAFRELNPIGDSP